MYMLLKDGKKKVLTFSYDDGVVQDIRLIDIFNKYGLKGSFNINTGLYFPEDAVREKYYGRMKLSEAKALYTNSGHEVAVHALTHPFLEKLSETAVLEEILTDRRNIEKDYGTIARGMAYPYGTYSDTVIRALRACGICYSRTVVSTGAFTFPENWLTLDPTCHHNDPKLMEMAERFVNGSVEPARGVQMFYVWGHSYEFDNNDNWNVIEELAAYVSGKEDIWYATNIEVYDYVQAYKALQTSVDEKIIHNPSALDVWFSKDGEAYCVKAGETLCI